LLPNAAPFGAATLLNLGRSDTRWGALILPFDLSVIGVPGCTVWASVDDSSRVVMQTGAALWPLGIPNDVRLLDARFYQQALIVDPAANTAGISLTNGGVATIGR
jgi:hypothetical protein